MRPFTTRASRAARRVINRSPRLKGLLWPTTDAGLNRPRDAALVVSAMYRSLTGREPDERERAELLARAAQGRDFAALAAELQASPPGIDLALARTPVALRQQLEADIEEHGTEPGTARVLYLHLMKTAGTSLSRLLDQWAGPGRARVGLPLDDLLVMSRPQLGRLRAVAGHFPYEVVGLLGRPFQTATVIREPVGRTLSHFQEVRRQHDPEGNLTLDEFVHSEVYAVPSGNYQARQLAHTIDLDQAWISYSPMQRYLQAGGQPDQPYPLQALFDSTPIFLSDGDLHKLASAHLAQIDVVGVTEDLDTLVARLAGLFGAPSAETPRLNTTPPGAHPDLTAALRRHIERRTEVDRELYEQAVKLSRG